MDTKHYTLLKDGAYAVSKVDWDADINKLAVNPDGTNKPDGVTLYIYTDGAYEDGCSYAFAKSGHWYLY